MSNILDVKNISLSLGSASVLENVNFSVKNGEKIAIVGANGSGKSSLLSVISCFLTPSQGSVLFHGQNVTRFNRNDQLRSYRSQVGIVHQGGNLVGRLSALENVLVGRLGKNHSPRTWMRKFTNTDRKTAEIALEKVGLSHKRDQRTDTLSGGERQRVSIARAIAQEATLLLADEPTSALDPKASRATADLLVQLADEFGLTLLLVLHDIELLPVVSNRVIGLCDGRIEFDEASEHLQPGQLARLYEGQAIL